jgi:Flp pilus assembly protein TadG
MVRRDEGSSMVELAIMLPVFLILFAGTAELGRLFYTYTTLAKATKVGARYLSTSRDATSTDAAKIAAVRLEAQSLVVCGYASCTGNQPDGTPKKAIVTGLNLNNPAANVVVTLPVAGAAVKYVKVEIQGYSLTPGVFNLAGMTGHTNTTFYFPLVPATQMRYMQ